MDKFYNFSHFILYRVPFIFYCSHLECLTLSGALLELNDLENGLRALKQSLLLSPDDAIVIINTCYFMLLNKNYREALDLITRFNNLTDDDSRLFKEVS